MNSIVKRGVIGCGMFLLATAGASLAVYRMRDHEPRLLARSRSVLALPPGIMDLPPIYIWITSTDLLLFSASSPGYSAQRVKLDTNTKVPVPGITELVNTDASVDFAKCLSPDHKLLIVAQAVKPKTPPRIVACDLQGQIVRTWNETTKQDVYYSKPIWLQDSRHWLLIGHTRQDSLTSALHYVDGTRTQASRLLLHEKYATELGCDSQGRVWVFDDDADHNQYGVTACSLGANSIVQGTRMSLPPNVMDREVKLSPDGGSIAFALESGGKSVFPRWTWRFGDLGLKRAPFKQSIWVCSTDGTGMREIGGDVEGTNTGGLLQDLEWLPDGKSLSFVLDGRLWVTPAN